MLRRLVVVASTGASALRACPVASTRKWIKDVVVGLSLCPWAAGALQSGDLRVRQCAVDDAVPRALEVLEEVARTPGATVALALEGACSFPAYLDIVADVDDAIDERGHRGTVQLATFHPDYEFGDDDAAAASHWTNRSPFPVLHLLREEDVSAALEGYEAPDDDAAAEAIWRRNVAVVERIGPEAMRRKVAACAVPRPD